MPNPEIEEFAKLLIQKVRDKAVQSSDRRLRAGINHAVAKRWRHAASGGSDLESIGAVLAPDIIDDTIFHLLQAIDDGRVLPCWGQVSTVAVVGVVAKLAS
jgi:hypothetical protein